MFMLIPLSEIFLVFLRRAYDLSNNVSRPTDFYLFKFPDSLMKLEVKDIVFDGFVSFNIASLDGLLF